MRTNAKNHRKLPDSEPFDPQKILKALQAIRKGDFSVRLSPESGIAGEIAETLNDIIEINARMAAEFERISRVVGKEGKLAERASLGTPTGSWATSVESVNSLIGDLVQPTTEVARVIGSVAKGDLSQTIALEVDGRPVKGEFLRIAKVANTMVDQLSSFASEVTRVAREVGTEGKLGGQAQVKGVAGTWKDLTDNVNSMANNLTNQVRNIADVTTAVAKGNLSKKITVDVKGEILQLKNTINTMVDQLSSFASEVTRVAREVGTEGKLGGQAQVKDVAGTWKDLTDNVNQLAANLTTQVRAIADVSTAVTKGDLTQFIKVEAQGEVAALKNNINEMIRNLRETTSKNADQDWLKTNLTNFSRMLQGQRDLDTVSQQILSELAPLVSALHGVFYVYDEAEKTKPPLKLLAGYGYKKRKKLPVQFELGEGLVGQCAKEKEKILVTDAPSDYIKINSGLGETKPLNIAILPVLFEGQIKAVLELASLNRFSEIHLSFLEQLTESIGIVLNTIAATMRTEALLKQSQSLAQELQKTNAELEDKARLLSDQKKEVENKNQEIEFARQAIEEKAEQLALTSKYKSQFLANMSHELRTPLNSLLILSRTLAENTDNNLTSKQVEFAKTINSSGNDLLSLISDILDLSKIESGTITIEPSEVRFTEIHDYVERGFRQVAQEKGLEFTIELDPNLPKAVRTDSKRLQQVLRNLLSNALKFTEKGKVSLKMDVVQEGWNIGLETLNNAPTVLAFSVSDTGIGIPHNKQKIVFEAFQQVDMTTSRKYGGTGLGLSISREITQMLGGEIRLNSTPGQGSTFTLYLPQSYIPSKQHKNRTPEGAILEVSLPPEKTAADGESPIKEVGPILANSSISQEIEDDRSEIQPSDRVLLIMEDDMTLACILRDIGREMGFKTLVATRGDSGLALIQKYMPHAITLDLHLPDIDGWALFDRLKYNPKTRHIPIQIISAKEQRQQGLSQGAFSYLLKPVSREVMTESLKKMKHYTERPERSLLVVEDNDTQRKSIVELLSSETIHIMAVATGREALTAIESSPFDGMVLDLKLPDMTGVELISKIKDKTRLWELPVLVYTGKELTKREDHQLRQVAQAVIVKDAQSPEHLLDEVAVFLHLGQQQLSELQKRMLEEYHKKQPLLVGKTVLVVDDDIRNIFALSSVLEGYRMKVLYAENGKEGLQKLQSTPGIDIVLMDVMMPDMDGYETTQAIRKLSEFQSLPIIALTAKAMKGDREKCIEAGASDYIPKPVELEHLLSLLRVWLRRASSHERIRMA
ncbi:MAG: response regulator [Elusimicrobia bacterium]|nr:response regulator [Elusimicrobiota bacterium]